MKLKDPIISLLLYALYDAYVKPDDDFVKKEELNSMFLELLPIAKDGKDGIVPEPLLTSDQVGFLRKGKFLYNVIDKHTGENVTFRKVTKTVNGNDLSLDVVDNIMYMKIGNEYFVRHFRDHVDVRWFGGIGDYNETTGTDNTEAFQKAIDWLINSGGGSLYFPSGKYLISGTVYINPANHIPISLVGSTKFSRNNGNRFSGSCIVKNTDGDCFRVNMDAEGAGNIAYPEQYGGFSAQGFNFRALPGVNVSAFKMWRTRSIIEGISSNSLNYVVYQPNQDQKGDTNYCDHSTFKDIRISNSNLGGLYLYASDASFVQGIYLETTQETFKGVLSVISTRSIQIEGFNFWSRVEHPTTDDSRLFYFNSCRGVSVRNIHVERSWIKDIFYFAYCDGVDVSGLTTEFLFNNAFRFRYANKNVSIGSWVSRADLKPGGSDIAIDSGPEHSAVTLNHISLETQDKVSRALVVNNLSSVATDKLIRKSVTVAADNSQELKLVNKVLISSADALVIPSEGYTVFLRDDPSGATSRVITLPDLPLNRAGEIKIINRSSVTSWSISSKIESIDGRVSYLIPRKSVTNLVVGVDSWLVDTKNFSYGVVDWNTVEGSKFITGSTATLNKPIGLNLGGAGVQILMDDKQEYRKLLVNFGSIWYSKDVNNNIAADWIKMIDERSVPKYLTVEGVMPTKAELNQSYGTYKAGSIISYPIIGYDFLKLIDANVSDWVCTKWEDGTKTLL